MGRVCVSSPGLFACMRLGEAVPTVSRWRADAHAVCAERFK